MVHGLIFPALCVCVCCVSFYFIFCTQKRAPDVAAIPVVLSISFFPIAHRKQ